MTHKYIVMQLSSASEAFEKGVISQLACGKAHHSQEPFPHFQAWQRERKWGRWKESRERGSNCGKMQLPAGSHKRHLPVVSFEPSCHRGWQVFWPGDTDAWLSIHAAGASSKGPGYSTAIFDLIFPLMFYSDLGCFSPRGHMWNREGKRDAWLSFEMQGRECIMWWRETPVVCRVCVCAFGRERKSW